MNFILWAARSLHVFAVVVWLGGLLYQAAVTFPVARVEHAEFAAVTRHFLRRFVPFVWFCVSTILVTGIMLMLFSPNFIFFQYQDRWSIMLGLKQMTFLVMLVFSFGYARMLSKVDEHLSAGESRPLDDIIPYYQRMLQFGRMNVGLGIAAILLAVGMY